MTKVDRFVFSLGQRRLIKGTRILQTIKIQWHLYVSESLDYISESLNCVILEAVTRVNFPFLKTFGKANEAKLHYRCLFSRGFGTY